MAATKKKSSLGKGLNVLFDEAITVTEETNVKENPDYTVLKWNDIDPDKSQPRKVFDEEALNVLADSIKTHGIINPVIVRKVGDRYVLIAGERRWRAAKLAGVSDIPAIVKDYDEQQTAVVALIDNLQREDLNTIEEAEGMQRLMDEFNFTQEQVAQSVGKSRPAVANTVRLLSLPEPVKKLVSERVLPPGQARLLCSFDEEELQIKYANEILSRGMNTRQAEQYIAKIKAEPAEPKKPEKKPQPIFIADIEQNLEQKLQTKVRVNYGAKKGSIEIAYFGEDELDRIYELLLGK
ncbi:MAG: ParB/RepB/Spo0J family partition protein [Clostridiales bacterium]|nr:ParB/RepB/Spo0J family partition protein [Clostridiales bacterium]